MELNENRDVDLCARVEQNGHEISGGTSSKESLAVEDFDDVLDDDVSVAVKAHNPERLSGASYTRHSFER